MTSTATLRRLAALSALFAALLPAALRAGALDGMPASGLSKGPAPVPAEAPQAAPRSVFNPPFKLGQPAAATSPSRGLGGAWAFGLEHLPGLAQEGSGALATPNALSLRTWWSQRLGFELAAALAPTELSGTSFSLSGGLPANSALGMGARWRLGSSAGQVLPLAIAKFSWARRVEAPSSGGSLETFTQAAFFGLGCEAFIPGWENLSLEASAGACVIDRSSSLDGQPAVLSRSLSLGGWGASPLNLSAHLYF